ncbi:MAG: LysM peptidoglycan-binding domain-containing protein [Bacteroidales bacterium]|jgi:ABC-type branched-subunit amino acid transport system substrate-binding protein|nr:LysM peptidoglycan-binding domain-containing protein [Bacteroidales bacterium]
MIKKYIKILLFIVVLFVCNNGYCQKQDDGYGTHTVKQGETLYSISKTFYLSVKDVLEANKEIKDSIIKIGQTLRIPKTVRNNDLFNQEITKPNEDSSNYSKINSEALYKSSKKQNATKKINKKTHLNIAILLPLYYENIDELGFNKYNIAEKKGKNFKCFNYISFYEGARIALDKLEKQGYNISLYVFDVGEDDVSKMKHALDYPSMKEMNLIISLVFKNSFNLVSEFCKQNEIPLVNPMSQLSAILDNPYVFKIQPSDKAENESVLKYIKTKVENANIVVLYDDAVDKGLFNYYKDYLTANSSSWTMLNWRKYQSKLVSKILKDKNNIVINLIGKGNEREDIVYCNALLKKLQASKGNITLFSNYSWLEFRSIDYALLEKFNYHFTLSYLNDYSNPNFVAFVKDYRKNFMTEPDKIYAAMGYDVITYFISAMIEKGEEFITNPNIKNEKNMINRYHFVRSDNNHGFMNKTTTIYKLSNYKIISVCSF